MAITTGGFMAGSIVAKLVVDKTGWDTSMAQVRRDTEMLATQASKAAAGISAVGKSMLMLGGAIVGMAGVAVAAFTKFDDSMKQSLAIMGDLTETMKEDLAEVARDVARETTVSSEKAAAAYYFLASAGMSAAESMKALPVVAKFAQAGMFDMERSTVLLADAQTALGLRIRDDAVANMENMARVADVLSKANILANGTIEQFSEALTNRAGPALRMVGKDVEEGVAALAVMANAGIKGAEAGTRLDIVLRDLQTRAQKNKDAFDKYGVAVYDSTGEMRNMADIIGELEIAFKGKSDEQRRAILMEMDFQDRSVASLLSLIGFSKELRNFERELRNAGGTTEEIAKKQLESLKSQLILTKNEITLLAEALGSSLAPIVVKVNEALRGLIKTFTEFVENNKAWVGIIGGLVVVFGALALALGAVLVPLGAMLASFAVISVAAPGLAAALAPVLIALAAIAVVIAAVVAAFAGWKIGEWIGKVTGLNKVIQSLYGFGIKVAQFLGLWRDAQGEVVESTDRLAKRQLFLSTASQISGREITNLMEAVKILKKEFAETGDLGVPELNEWAQKAQASAKAAEEAKKSVGALGRPFDELYRLVPGVTTEMKQFGSAVDGVFVAWPGYAEFIKGVNKELKDTQAAASSKAWEELLKKYDLMSKTDIESKLRIAREELEQYRKSAEATPGGIKAIQDAIVDLETKLTGVEPKYRTGAEAVEYFTEKIDKQVEAWNKATGLDFDLISKIKKGHPDTLILPAEIEFEIDEPSMMDGKKVALGFLDEILAEAALASNKASQEIRDAIYAMGVGSMTPLKNEMALIGAVLDQVEQGIVKLPAWKIAELKERYKELTDAVKDPTPWDIFMANVQMTLDSIKESWDILGSAISGIVNQAQLNSEIAIENEYKKRLDYINRTVKDEKKKQEAITALEAEYEIKKSKARAAAARLAKAQALAQAVINVAEAVTKAYAQGGFFGGPIFAAIIGALGAIQIGLIAAQPIPMAEGGQFNEPTLLQNVLVGEAGPEYLLPEKKITRIVQDAISAPRFDGAPALAPALAGAGGAQLTVNFNSPLISATGYSKQDILTAGEELKYIIEEQFRRIGRRI